MTTRPRPFVIPDSDPLAVALDHDYGDDATLLANFLTVPHPTRRQQAAITLLCMAVRAPLPVVVDEDAVDVCAAAIFDVTRLHGPVSPAACATLAHLACRAFAPPGGGADGRRRPARVLAIGEAAAAVIEGTA
jgi:hypothetical protein